MRRVICGNNRRGSAYVFVLIVTMLLFLLISITVAVASYGRQLSAHYARYAGLYDLAVSGNEQILRLLSDELIRKKDDIDAATREMFSQKDFYTHLIYRDGQFHLTAPEDEYFAKLYQTAAEEALGAYLEDEAGKMYDLYYWEWKATASYTDEAGETGEAATPVHETYNAYTTLEKRGEGYVINTNISKTVNGQTGAPMDVEAEIVFRYPSHEEIFHPVYAWRDMPSYADVCLYTAGRVLESGLAEDEPVSLSGEVFMENAPSLAVITDASLRAALEAADDPAFILHTEPALDVSLLYDGGTPAPVFVIHEGGPLSLYASDPARNTFAGVLLCYSEIFIDAVNIEGTLLADGNITVTLPGVYTPRSDMLFAIPLSEAARKSAFDFLRLTRFSEAGGGPVTDIRWLLNRLSIDTDGDFILEINNFDGVTLEMIKSKKIAN